MPYNPQAAVPSGAGNVQTFVLEADRARLAPAALSAVKNLAKKWGLTRDETAKLIAMSPSSWDRMISNPTAQCPSQDQMTRISVIIGIFKGLNLLFADDMANRWPRLKNAGQLFNDHSPIELMITGGIPIMLEIRRHVDGLRGGM